MKKYLLVFSGLTLDGRIQQGNMPFDTTVLTLAACRRAILAYCKRLAEKGVEVDPDQMMITGAILLDNDEV